MNVGDAMARESAGGSPDAAARRLAEGLARQVARWARPGLDARQRELVAAAAEALSLAHSDGHVCLDLASLAAALGTEDSVLRALLLDSGVVAPAQADAFDGCPLVLDADGRLYVQRAFDEERRLARRLVRAQRETVAVGPAARAALRRLAPSTSDEEAGPDWQQVATALALTRRLAVVSGGPGTGKTTSVVHLLACLLAEQPEARIALAAPTGKAAARMTEALADRAAALPPALRERLPREASTIHRLLGAGRRGFRHDAQHPLPLDVLVVDEASMLDLALAARLLEAVPPHARIVLLGDQDQLAAVESGAVFAELCVDPGLSEAARRELAALCGLRPERLVPPAPRACTSRSPLADSTVWLERNYRFASGSRIGALSRHVRSGDADAALALLERAEGRDEPEASSLEWIEEDDDAREASAGVLDALHEGYAPYLEALARDPHDIAAAHEAFARFRVLCAQHAGPRGVDALNALMEGHARERLASGGDAVPTRSPWPLGRPVIVLRNDPLQKLWNGDVGLVLPDANGRLAVHFPSSDGFRAIAPQRLPAHASAWAMSVHKAQGSEFDAVLVLLARAGSRLGTREWLYTAATRARRSLRIAASREAIAAAIATPTQRRSGLLARLAEAAAAMQPVSPLPAEAAKTNGPAQLSFDWLTP